MNWPGQNANDNFCYWFIVKTKGKVAKGRLHGWVRIIWSKRECGDQPGERARLGGTRKAKRNKVGRL